MDKVTSVFFNCVVYALFDPLLRFLPIMIVLVPSDDFSETSATYAGMRWVKISSLFGDERSNGTN